MILANSQILPNAPGVFGNCNLKWRLVFRDSRYHGGKYPISMPFETYAEAEKELNSRLAERAKHEISI